MLNIEFEVSDYLRDDGVAVIPLTDQHFIAEDLAFRLINPLCAREINFELSTTALYTHLNRLSIVSNSSCNVNIEVKDHKLSIDELKAANVAFGRECGFAVGKLGITGHRVDSYLPRADHIAIDFSPDENDQALRDLIKAVDIIPGSGELALDPLASLAPYCKWVMDGMIGGSELSVRQMQGDLPNLKWTAPVVVWFGTDLDIGKCKIVPGVENKEYYRKYKRHDDIWQVAGFSRERAHMVMRDPEDNERPNYGGTINDESVLRYLELLGAKGYKKMLYPVIFMDVEGKNWRGEVGGSADDIVKFFEGERGYNKFILHYAKLVKGKVEAFIIGSEFKTLTHVQDKDGSFPAVKQLIKLAKEVKAILGREVIVTYAADWSEYHHGDGGSRQLDELWASEYIDVVGIDTYFPLTAKAKGEVTVEEIKRGCESGEIYDYYLDGEGKEQALGADWALKNVRHWWETKHYFNGVETAWQPKMKKIWFTELGFGSIHYSSNQPNVFYDPKCVNGGVPKHSSGITDFEGQKVALRGALEYWETQEYVDNIFVWTYDARPYPAYPYNTHLWSDGRLWEKGHWLNGKFHNYGTLTLRGALNIKTLQVTNAKEVMFEHSSGSISNTFISGHDSFLTVAANNSSALRIGELEVILEPAAGISELWLPDGVQFGEVTLNIAQLSGDRLLIKAKHLCLTPDHHLHFPKAIILDIAGGDLIIDHKFWTTERTEHHEKGYGLFKADHTRVFQLSSETIMLAAARATLSGVKLNAGRLALVVDDLNLLSIIKTAYEHHHFVGGANIRGRNKSDRYFTNQELEYTEIAAGEVFADINGKLYASGAIIKTGKFEGQAREYEFRSVTLLKDHKEEQSKQRSGNIFKGPKYSHSASGGTVAHAAVLESQGKCYLFAESSITIAGSKILGAETALLAPTILLKAAIEDYREEISVSQSGIRFNINCKPGELSAGVGAYASSVNREVSGQRAVMAEVIGGSSLVIKTELLQQFGGYLKAGRALIEAERWESVAPTLRFTDITSSTHAEIGLRIGFQESFSAVGQAAARARGEAERGENASAISSAYQGVRGAVNIAAGGGVQGGIWVAGDATTNDRDEIVTVQVPNIIEADELVANAQSFSSRGTIFAGGSSGNSRHELNFAESQWYGRTETASVEQTRASISGQIALQGNIRPNLTLAAGHHESEGERTIPDQISVEELVLTGNKAKGVLRVNARRIQVELNVLELETAQSSFSARGREVSLSLNPMAGSGQGNNPLQNVYGERIVLRCEVVEQRSGINAESGEINVRKLKLVGASITSPTHTAATTDPASSITSIPTPLTINAQELETVTLHDYREGNTIGLGFGRASNNNNNASSLAFGPETRINAGETELERDIGPVISSSVRVLVNGIEVSESERDQYNLESEEDLPEFTGTNWNADVTWSTPNLEGIRESLQGGPVGIANRVVQGAGEAVSNVVEGTAAIANTLLPRQESAEGNNDANTPIFVSHRIAQAILNSGIAAGDDLEAALDEEEIDEQNETTNAIVEFINDSELVKVVKAGWDESQEDSAARRNQSIIPSDDYFIENLAKIHAGDQSMLLKVVSSLNQIVGGTARYSVDLVKNMLAHLDPATKATLNAISHGIGYGVNQALPNTVLDKLAKLQQHIDNTYPDANEKFIVQTATGILLAETGFGAAKLVVKPAKIGANNLASLFRVEVEAGESTLVKPKQFDPNAPQIYEPWMKRVSLSTENKEQLAGKNLFGQNPVTVKAEAHGVIKVHTELPGNEQTARQYFEALTGEKPPQDIPVPDGHPFKFPDGTEVRIRSIGSSGHPKIDINGKNAPSKTYEKITFKENK